VATEPVPHRPPAAVGAGRARPSRGARRRGRGWRALHSGGRSRWCSSVSTVIWRIVIENADWETVNDNTDPWSFNQDYYVRVYESSKFRNTWDTIAALNAKGATVVLSTMGVVPSWMGGRIIRPELEDEWVEMIVSLVHHARRHRNLDIRLLGPVNEPDIGAPEGPSIDPTQLTRLLNKLALHLDRVGLSDVEFVAPDTAHIKRAPEYIRSLLEARGLTSRIAHVAVHNYEGKLGAVPSLANQFDRSRLWVTEWASSCPRCDEGQAVADEWAFSFASVRHLLSHMRDGASAAMFYEAYDSGYEHHDGHISRYGLLAREEPLSLPRPRKRFFALAQIANTVASGSVRIGSRSPDDLPLEAFLHEATGRVVVVGVNPTASARTVRLRLANLEAVDRFAYSVTTATRDLQIQPDLIATDRIISASIPAGAIFALTSPAAGRR